MTTCKMDDCPLDAKRVGYCQKHYSYARRHGLIPGSKPCSIPDCTNAAVARGWCQMHHTRWLENGDPLKVKTHAEYRCRVHGCQEPHHWKGLCQKHYTEFKTTKPCSIPGCDLPAKSRGWCSKHYARWQRYGDTETTHKRPNGTGSTCNGYVQFTNPDKNGPHFLFEHRQIVEEHLGRPLTKDEIVHHRDGNGLNNAPDNLVVLSRVQHIYIGHFVDALRKMTPESLALAVEQAQAMGYSLTPTD